MSDTVGFGLLVPTLFRRKPGFQEDTSNLYYIIHGTTSKGAPRILAEELIRPGDFQRHHDPYQSGFPAYGHCSAGQKAEEATPSPFNLKQLTKKVLRTSLFVEPMLVDTPTKSIRWTAMMKPKSFVENMALPGGNTTSWWLGRSIQQ